MAYFDMQRNEIIQQERNSADTNYIDHRRRRDSELRTQFSEGLEEGKRETARSMKKEGIPAEIIQKCTKLSLDEIDKL